MKEIKVRLLSLKNLNFKSINGLIQSFEAIVTLTNSVRRLSNVIIQNFVPEIGKELIQLLVSTTYPVDVSTFVSSGERVLSAWFLCCRSDPGRIVVMNIQPLYPKGRSPCRGRMASLVSRTESISLTKRRDHCVVRILSRVMTSPHIRQIFSLQNLALDRSR